MGNWLSGVRSLAAALGRGSFFVVVIRNVGSDEKACGRLQIWLLDRTGRGRRSGLVDDEGIRASTEDPDEDPDERGGSERGSRRAPRIQVGSRDLDEDPSEQQGS